ncbi:MAG: SMC-Scp complex subunit ScpB, partial [Ottowia sp.]|nr:SMC-Scp complex subunit ScpB [Ottowia sp.]
SETLDLETRSPKSARIEAALLVAGQPLSARKLAQFAAIADVREVQELVNQLNSSYERTDSTFRIERVASGYQLLTLPRFAPWLDRLHHRQQHLKLSPPMMETLAIVAYRQPVTRADVEAVRGVQSAEILKQLMERGVVKIVGADDSLGRPYLYGTTRQFLELYGLTSLNELPMS